MSRTAWKFTDPETLEEYLFPVNPFQDSGVSYNKNFRYLASITARKSGFGLDTISTVINQSHIDVKTPSYTGYTYTEEQFDNMQYWANKNYPVELSDDLGRSWLIRIRSFKPERVRSRSFPYKHRYVLEFIILEEL